MAISPKVAVIGTGSIGCRHLQVLKSLGVPVVAVSVRETRRLELKSQGWFCAKSIAEARHGGANLAVIATDTRRHVADTEEALNLGFNILLEKPMGTSAAQVAHLPPLATQYGLKLFIGCPLRFDPGLTAIRRKITDIGAIHAIQIECRSYLPNWRPSRDYRTTYSARADEGGVLRDLIHEIDYAIWLFGMPQQVSGELRNLGRLGIQTEEMAEGHWSAPSGGFVSIELDYLSGIPRRRISIHGVGGTLEYNFINRKFQLQTVGSPVEEMNFKITKDDLYIQQMNEFLQVASGGKPCLISSAEDGVNALAVCDAWRRSAMSQNFEQVTL